MARSRPQVEPDNIEEPLEEQDQATDERPAPWWLRAAGGLACVVLLLIVSFEIVYAGKVLPGVSVDGIYVGGQSRDSVTKILSNKTAEFAGQVVTISEGDTHLRIPVSSLGVTYNTAQGAEKAYAYGRQGSLWQRINEQFHAITSQDTRIATFRYDNSRLVPYLTELDDSLSTPVADAALSFDASQPQVTPAQAGTRLDLGRLTREVTDRLGRVSTDPIAAPVYKLEPSLQTSALKAATTKLSEYVAGPITLQYSGTEQVIDQKTIISWLQIGAPPVREFLVTRNLGDLYPSPVAAKVELSKTAVQKYVQALAGNLDQTPSNAGLAMQDGKLTITRPSRSGIKLDQPKAIAAITDSLSRSASQRDVELKLDTTPADVNENNLESLGIKEQISEGETYFPGSPSTRLTNVRAGAKRFDGVLLKPGETFSFGALLGEVGPQTGYVPELVILENREEKQYGGGLCQVSSTAFRAALQAGLPITQRVNHSFAISYYTWPYAAPGVDATIYYPSVDFKFVNDTGSYILMQTVMSGVNLKFTFFGTKTKSGTIRGPEFISGSNDATKPSHTVFYRDVLDLSGKVVKTDKFDTWYKSSKDFPIQGQYN